MSHARFNRRYDQRGATPPGMRTFALLEEWTTNVRWRYREITDDTLVCFPLNGELQTVSSPGFGAFTLTFPEALLAEQAEALGVPDLVEFLGDGEKVLRVAPPKMHELRSQLQAVCRAVSENPLRLNDPSLVCTLEFDLLEQLIAAIASTRSVPAATMISEVASRWGFWHMSQFALDYRRLFGESPSATLKRRTG